MSVLAKYRSPGVRPANHRWVVAERIVAENFGRHLLDSKLSKRAVWHPDEHVRTLVRLMALTNKLDWLPQEDDLRENDQYYLSAVDLMTSDETARSKSTLECLLLGGADNETVGQYMNVEPQVVQLCHDVFFDVRDRLDKPLLVEDIFFPPAVMQGGVKDPVSAERVIAYFTGHQLFFCFRIGYYEDKKVQQAFEKLEKGLMQNQTISALLRRSFGYQSTESAIEHMQQHLLVSARAAAADAATGGEDPEVTRVRHGVQALLSHNLAPEVVREGDATFSAMARESTTMAADRIQETIQ